MTEQIIIEVDGTGGTQVKVEGHAGPGCKTLTEGIEKALGEVTEDKPTHEYHQRATQRQNAAARR